MTGKCKNCNNLKNDWCEKVIDSPDPDMVRECRYFSQQTNADRIRAMSDEELALYLQNWCTAAACKYGDNYFACENFIADGECDKCVVDWLRQPVKDGDNNG